VKLSDRPVFPEQTSVEACAKAGRSGDTFGALYGCKFWVVISPTSPQHHYARTGPSKCFLGIIPCCHQLHDSISVNHTTHEDIDGDLFLRHEPVLHKVGIHSLVRIASRRSSSLSSRLSLSIYVGSDPVRSRDSAAYERIVFFRLSFSIYAGSDPVRSRDSTPYEHIGAGRDSTDEELNRFTYGSSEIHLTRGRRRFLAPACWTIIDLATCSATRIIMTLKCCLEQAISLDPSVTPASVYFNQETDVAESTDLAVMVKGIVGHLLSCLVVTHTPTVLDYVDKSIEFSFAE
jgi:hypothetical protein